MGSVTDPTLAAAAAQGASSAVSNGASAVANNALTNPTANALGAAGGAPPEWLTQLAPSHAPPPTGWWPLAPGWWILLVLSLALTALAIWWPRRPQVRLRRAALRELTQLASDTGGDAELARQLEHLVRRVAVARYGRGTVAGLTGSRWIDFVVAHGGTDWAGDTGAGLLRAAYGGTPPAADGATLQAANGSPPTSERARWLSGARAFFKARQ